MNSHVTKVGAFLFNEGAEQSIKTNQLKQIQSISINSKQIN